MRRVVLKYAPCRPHLQESGGRGAGLAACARVATWKEGSRSAEGSPGFESVFFGRDCVRPRMVVFRVPEGIVKVAYPADFSLCRQAV